MMGNNKRVDKVIDTLVLLSIDKRRFKVYNYISKAIGEKLCIHIYQQ